VECAGAGAATAEGSVLMEFFKTIRGVEVVVHAEQFDGDPSVGIGYGPEVVYATTHDGTPFELTDEEVELLGMEAAEAYDDDDF
jgi:hypothetical protein